MHSYYYGFGDTTTPKPQLWEPRDVLQLPNPAKLYQITCVGYAPSKGRRCQNPIAAGTIRWALDSLQELSFETAAAASKSPRLKVAAGTLLCRRHGDQAASVAQSWSSQLRDCAADRSRTTRASYSPSLSSDDDNDNFTFPGRRFKQEPKEEADIAEAIASFMKKIVALEEQARELRARQAQRQSANQNPSSTPKERSAFDDKEEEEQRREKERIKEEERQREEYEQERREQERREQERRERERREQEKREEEERKEQERKKQEEKTRADNIRERARATREKREREAKEKEEREAKEWADAWKRYTSAWESLRRGDSSNVKDKKIPWPVKSGLREDVTESNVKAFFLHCPLQGSTDDREARFRFFKLEVQRWHTDKVMQVFGQAVANGPLKETLGMIATLAVGLKDQSRR